jgi:NADH pyrophosphatase NudC (nudix superfamily)
MMATMATSSNAAFTGGVSKTAEAISAGPSMTLPKVCGTQNIRSFVPAQAFAGNRLNRSLTPKTDEQFMKTVLKAESTRIVLIANSRKVVCAQDIRDRSEGTEEACILRLSLFRVRDVLNVTGVVCGDEIVDKHTCVLLGYNENEDSWVVAADIANMTPESLGMLPDRNPGGKLSMEDGRKVLIFMEDYAEKAIAGQALAMCSWHSVNKFDGVLGKPTRSIECGLKRAASSDPVQNDKVAKSRVIKVYPRIDPVVISLVISPDGSKILLGNMKTMPKPFYSCLSGFVEVCESVEEAVRREVWEESGIRLKCVKLMASQPWPIGRGGGCELMLACVSLAETTAIEIHDNDVNDVRWFTAAELQEVLDEAKRNTMVSFEERVRQYEVIIPGTYAVAHHLIEKYLLLANANALGELFEEFKKPPPSCEKPNHQISRENPTPGTPFIIGTVIGMFLLSLLTSNTM